MPPFRTHAELVAQWRQLLAVTIKVDIAQAIRQHPHLAGDAAVEAYEKLSQTETVGRLVRELAYEETLAAVRRGEAPPAALILLAGFRANPAQSN
jgi:hypothetical protein